MSLKSFSKTQEIEKGKETTAMQLHLEKVLVSCGSPILLNKKEKILCQGRLSGALTFPSPFQTAWPPIRCLFYLVTEKKANCSILHVRKWNVIFWKSSVMSSDQYALLKSIHREVWQFSSQLNQISLRNYQLMELFAQKCLKLKH